MSQFPSWMLNFENYMASSCSVSWTHHFVHTGQATTTYTVDVTSGSTTCTSDPTIITVQPLPTVDLGADVVICNGVLKH